MALVTLLHRFADYDDVPNNILVFHYLDSRETARAYLNHPYE